MGPEPQPCELCGRAVVVRTRHHLIPRTRHKKAIKSGRFDRDTVLSRVAWLCKPCHKQIHAVLSEKELEADFHTLEALREHDAIAKFLEWIRGRPDGTPVTVFRRRR